MPESYGNLAVELYSNPRMPHAKAPFCRCSDERQGFKDREEDSQALRKATLLREYVETGNLMVAVLVLVKQTAHNTQPPIWVHTLQNH